MKNYWKTRPVYEIGSESNIKRQFGSASACVCARSRLLLLWLPSSRIYWCRSSNIVLFNYFTCNRSGLSYKRRGFFAYLGVVCFDCFQFFYAQQTLENKIFQWVVQVKFKWIFFTDLTSSSSLSGHVPQHRQKQLQQKQKQQKQQQQKQLVKNVHSSRHWGEKNKTKISDVLFFLFWRFEITRNHLE